MSADAWITLAAVALMLFALVRELATPAAIVLGTTVLLLVLDVIDSEQAFAGFSNAAPLTVAALYVVARAVEKTGLLGPFVTRLLGGGGAPDRRALARLMFPTAGASAFLNNTPLVGMLIPEITSWARRHNVSASRLLMPLSFAAILGGTMTVLGTSTNLVVSGLLEESGREPFSIFEITPVGAAVAGIGLILMLIVVPLLLPEREGPDETVSRHAREFVVEMVVEPGGKLDGMTIENAGLRNLAGVYLVEIERAGRLRVAASPATELAGGDRLTFVGRVDQIVDLARIKGLQSAEDEHLLEVESPQHTFYETVLGPSSPLVGSTLAEVGFRHRYQAAVVAIHRAGERVREKLGQVRLRTGDTLLVLADRDFRSRWREGRDFLLIARLGGAPPSASRMAPFVGLVVGSMVALAAFEVFDILEAAFLAAGALVATRVLSVSEARNAVNLDVIVVIAAAFGVGAAVESSGLAGEVSGTLIDTFGELGDIGVIAGVVVATMMLTEIITNNAAAAVIFPIAMAVATSAGVDPRAMAIAVAVTASASLLTPTGYQTNMMVYGPGGYRFTDYLRTGFPVSIAIIVIVVTMTYLMG